MKLGSIRSTTSKDGELVVVSRDLKKMATAKDIAPNFRSAVENWSQVKIALEKRFGELNAGTLSSAVDYNEKQMLSALPRTWMFADGSAFSRAAERCSAVYQTHVGPRSRDGRRDRHRTRLAGVRDNH